MRQLKSLVLIALLLPTLAAAQTILPGSRGGTGFATTTAGNVGKCLSVSANSPLVYAFTTCSGGGGGAWPFLPATNFGVSVQSTSTPISDSGGLFASSTSQFVNVNIWSVLNLEATTSSLLATDASGNVIATSSVGSNYITGILGTINTTYPLAGGGSFSRGGVLTLTTAATSTTILPLSFATGTNAYQCPTCNTSNATVSSVGLSTPNSTLTLGGTNPVTTTGTISADLNLAHSNWWTAAQNFTNASTSQFTATSSVWFTGVTASRILAVDNNGQLIASTSIGANLIAPNTISGIVLGNNLNSLSNDGATLSGSSYNGSSGISNWAVNLANQNIWTGASTTFTQHLALNTASTTQLTAPTLWTGLTAYNLLSTDANGKMVATGTVADNFLPSNVSSGSCTNCNVTFNAQGIATTYASGSAGGGSGTVGTSSAETANYVPWWTTSSAGVALLSGGSNLFQWLNAQGSHLIGTSTAQYGLITAGTSSAPQLLLSDNTAADKQWVFRNTGGLFFIATSTATATSSVSAFELDSNGFATIPAVKSALDLSDSNGKLTAYAGASACSSHNFVTTISATGGTTCGTDTISGVSFGSNLNSLSTNSSLTGSSYNGSAGVSNWGINLSNANSWAATQTFDNHGIVLSATTSALLGTNSAGQIVATTSVGWNYITGGPAGANPTASVGLSATNGSATTFMRSDAAPALSVSIAPTWTALHVFSAAASTTLFSVQGGALWVGQTSTSTIQGNGATSTIQGSLVAATTSPNAFVVQDQYGTQDVVVGTASTSGAIFTVQATSSTDTLFSVDQYGHITASSTKATPTVSSCGTSPTITAGSTDSVGSVTTGTGSPTSCTITFAAAFSKSPVVMIDDASTAVTADISAISTTAFTVSLSAALNSTKIYWIVVQGPANL